MDRNASASRSVAARRLILCPCPVRDFEGVHVFMALSSYLAGEVLSLFLPVPRMDNPVSGILQKSVFPGP